MDYLLDMSIDRFNALYQDLVDIESQEQAEQAHVDMVTSAGDRKAYGALQKGWKGMARRPKDENVVESVKAVASDLNQRGRRG